MSLRYVRSARSDSTRRRGGIAATLAAMGLVVSAAARAQDSIPDSLRQARVLTAAGQVEEAIQLADRYTRAHPGDEQGFLALGDAYFKRMPIGRFQAAEAYQRAERLAPQDPVPAFRYAEVGLWLGGDDGEGMARQGLEKVLALDPQYPDAWDDWLTLFRNTSSRSQMRRRLAPYADDPVVRARLALLAIEDERYREANGLLDSALAADSTCVSWLALRAQSAFEDRDTATGWVMYRRALAHADQDTTDALWHQIIGIARPWEIRGWGAVKPEQKGAWIESFWARRNPNLFAGVNHRVAEHFARLRYARKHYPLLHPLISYHRSSIARAMNLEPSRGEREWNLRCEVYKNMPPIRLHAPWIHGEDLIPPPGYHPAPTIADEMARAREMGVPDVGVASAADLARVNPSPWALLTDAEIAAAPTAIQKLIPRGVRMSLFAPLNLDLRSMDSIATRVGYNLATGLDDRGITYLRLGPADKEFAGGPNAADPQCASRAVERWEYAEYGEIRFARPSTFSRGEANVPDMVFRAMNERQFAGAETGLTTDATSEPAPLAFGVWTAQFANDSDLSLTDLVVVSTSGELAATLSGARSAGPVRQDSAGVVTLSASTGWYVLVAQVKEGNKLGRHTLQLNLRRFDRRPAVSGLMLAPVWEERHLDREAMLRHLSRSLVFEQGTAVRSYAEIYGLRADSGVVRFSVSYSLLRTDAPERDIQLADWPNATRFEFQRERRQVASGPEIETLDMVPAQVPPGRYLLRVQIRDLNADIEAGRGSTSFTVN